MGLDGALARYLSVARAEPFDQEAAKSAASGLLSAAASASPPESAEALSALAADVARDAESLVLSAVMAGALIERGAPGEALESVLFPRLQTWLAESVVLLDALLAEHPPAAGEQSVDDELDENEWVGTRLSEERPWALIGDTYLPAVALLGASPKARRGERALLPALRRLEPYHPGASWLRQMLDVLDDEPLVVIDVAARKGSAGSMSGVASNFELFVLIADAVAGELGLPRPPEAAVRCLSGQGAQDSGIVVEAAFNAYAYSALGAACKLPEASDYGGSAHWIWGEGEPWEIPALEGTRVVLIGPPSYARLVPAQRTFASLRARLDMRPMARDEVDAWIARIVRANAN
ncbi:MAG: hypothetical protein IPM35_39340 [Myxococcales bacterium]|nr:hypothetical protein [Myxococcales bacterium]